MYDVREVEIVSRYQSKTIPKKKYVAFALDVMDKLNMYGRVDMLFCGPEKIRELNKYFLGKNYPTDVLAFPSQTEGEDGIVNIGDIAICVKVAKKQSVEYGWTLEMEIKKLIVHAFLHLDGHDHTADNGRMARKEKSILKAMGVEA
jgi:probable rRNA maturation factor